MVILSPQGSVQPVPERIGKNFALQECKGLEMVSEWMAWRCDHSAT
jgi:hypothetical protein